MKSPPIRERHHRLPRDHYIGMKRGAFTLCIKDRIPIFRNASIAHGVLDLLEALCSEHHARIWVALCMPDHIHMLLEGSSPEADLWALIVRFKQQTGYLLYRRGLTARWQKDFYDHLLRDEEDQENQALYILNNPVRGGLAENWIQYPHKTSTVLDLTLPF